MDAEPLHIIIQHRPGRIEWSTSDGRTGTDPGDFATLGRVIDMLSEGGSRMVTTEIHPNEPIIISGGQLGSR